MLWLLINKLIKRKNVINSEAEAETNTQKNLAIWT